MSTAKKHKWVLETIQGYQVQVCESCDFWVVALHGHPQLPDGHSHYNPSQRMIVFGSKTISAKQADDLCKRHGAERCD